MKNGDSLRGKVTSILKGWKGSDAGRQALPNAVAQEIDDVYREYLESLPRQTEAIVAGAREWERKVA